MIRYALCLVFVGSILAGCGAGSGGDTSAADTKSKEQQIADATKKLNNGQTQPSQGQDAPQ